MKVKILLILSIMFIWILPIDLFAYTLDVPLQSEVLDFTDEFDFIQSASGILNYEKVTIGLNYTLMFKDDTPIWENNLSVLVGAYYDDIEDDILQSVIYYQIVLTGDGLPIDIKNLLLPFYHDDDLLNPDLLSFKSDASINLTTFRTFIETYVKVIYDTPLNIIDNAISRYYGSGVSDGYDEGLEFGLIQTDTYDVYNIGYELGYQNASDEAFKLGSETYGIYYDGQLLTASQYGNIKYNQGLAQGPEDTLAIRNMIPGILGITFAFFFQLASISFLGISALDLIAGVITIATAIFIMRIFLNR
jgi:hypothetical protein